MDWIDEERSRRANGQTRSLTQEQHRQVNARFTGCTLECCFLCDEPTGRAGKGDDSIYDDDNGPYCPDCWQEHQTRDSSYKEDR